MRISDWSSYVCSSDLFGQIRDFGCRQDGLAARDHGIERRPGQIEWRRCGGVKRATQQQGKQDEVETPTHGSTFVFQTDRKRLVLGKSVSVRVDLGGRRINKLNKKK